MNNIISNILWVNLALIPFTATLIVDIHTDVELWKKNIPVNHARGLLLRLLGLVPTIIILGTYSIPLIGFIYWFLFDGMFNRTRGFNWWFTGGSFSKKDVARTDLFLKSLPNLGQKLIKIIGIIISTYIYLKFGNPNFLRA